MKVINCPKCGKEIYKHDERGTMEIDLICVDCRKLVKYNPVMNTTRIIEIPERNSSSGVRFY